MKSSNIQFCLVGSCRLEGFQPVSNFLGDKCFCRKVKQVMIQNVKTVIRRRCGEKVKMLTGSAD